MPLADSGKDISNCWLPGASAIFAPDVSFGSEISRGGEPAVQIKE